MCLKLFFQTRDLAFCHICMTAKKEGKIGNTKVEGSFISDGFSNWKEGPVKFRKHDGSELPQGGGQATGDASRHYTRRRRGAVNGAR